MEGRNGPGAFRRTGKTGLRGLGFLPGDEHESRAEDVSGEGSRVVRSAASERSQVAFLWKRKRGMRALEAVLASEGAGLPEGGRLELAGGISRDGRAIVGSGTNPQGHQEAWAIFWPSALASH